MSACRMSIRRMDEDCEEEGQIPKTFICQYDGCQKSYFLKHHLARHVRIVHLGETLENKSVKCEKCQNTFASKQSLKKHVARKHKNFPYTCNICSEGFTKDTLLAHHLFLHTGEKILKCKYCERTFSNQSERCRHQAKHKTFTCISCNEKFNIWSEFLLHKKKNHQYEEYRCDICAKVFKSRNYIARHMKTHIFRDDRDVFSCTMCPKFYTFKSNLKHHIRSVHEDKTFDCKFPGCEAKLSTREKLKYHFKRHTTPIVKADSVGLKIRKVRRDQGTMKPISASKLGGAILPFKNNNITEERQEELSIVKVETDPPSDS